MTETTARIRWQDDGLSGNHAGYVGTLAGPAFRIYSPDAAHDDWLLSVRVAAGSEFIYDDGPEKLKDEAERWLERFVSSLGAVFPEDDDSAVFGDVTDEEAFVAQHAPGRRVRYAKTDAGYPADQKMAAALLTPGEVYTIAWSDIGFSSTRLGLAGVESRGQGFNSVLFEPVDDQDPAPKAAGEKE